MDSFELKFKKVETPLSLGSSKKLDILGVEKSEKISDLLNEAIATLGENIVIARFIRFAVGENSSSS